MIAINGNYRHAIIITDIDNEGRIKFTCHNNAHKNELLTAEWCNTYFGNVDAVYLIHITY